MSEDIGNDFMAGRNIAQRANFSDLDALLPGAAEAAGGVAAKKPVETKPEEDATQGWMQGGIPAPPPGAHIGSKIAHAAWSAAKDIGGGIVTAPKQIAGGVLDWWNNLNTFAARTADQIDQAGVPGYVSFTDKEGNFAPRLLTKSEYEEAGGETNPHLLDVPTTGEADTRTGAIIRAGTTFLVGRGKLAGKLGGGFAGNVGASAFSGATGTDTGQPRLSNLVDQVAPNFVTDWLKAKPDQEQGLLDNLKSGLEFAGLDAAFGGLVKTVKGMKAALAEHGDGDAIGGLDKLGKGGATGAPTEPGGGQLPGAAKTAGEAGPGAEQAAGETMVAARPVDHLPLGDPLAPAVPPATPEIASQAKSFIEGTGGENPIKLNLARIGSPDDIKMTLQQVSSMLPDDAVQSNQATIRLADSLGLTPQDFLTNYRGGNLNASETTAMRFMLDSSAGQLVQYAKAASADGSTPEAQALFLKAFSTHRAIQQYAENARAEAGRTLQSWAILSQERAGYSGAIQKLVEQGAGNDVQQIAQKIAGLGDLGRPETVSPFVGMLNRMSGRDAMVYGFQNLLLSPKTLLRKAGTDAAMPIWNVANRYLAERFGSGAIPQGEALEMAYGYMSSMKDGVKLAGKAIQAGRSQFLPYVSTVDTNDVAALSRLYNQVPSALGDAQPTKSAAELIKYAMPTTYIGALDDAAKYVNYRAELQALAYRDATKAGLEAGTDEFAQHMAGSLSTPPGWMHETAVSNTLKSTFTEPLTGNAERLAGLVDHLNWNIPHTEFEMPVGRMVMPFVKVPINLAAFTWRNTPLGLTYAQSQLRTQLAAGGAARELAVAKMTTGSALALTFAGLTYEGLMTGRGPSDPELRRAWIDAGNQPYSWRIGGQWASVFPEPFSQMAGAIADTADTLRFAKDRDAEQAVLSGAFGLGSVLLNRTYMRGVSNLFDAIDNPDKNSKNYFEQLASSFEPSSLKAVAEGMDDWQRAHYDIIDRIQAGLPWLRKGLPPQRTLWGDPVPLKDGFLPPLSGSGFARAVSPVQFAPADNAQPIDKWIWENRKFFNPDEDDNGRLGLSRLGPHVTFTVPGSHLSSSIELTAEALDRYQVLAGNELKDPSSGMGAKDTLNSLVEQKNPTSLQGQWDNASPELQAMMVKSIVYKFRSMAKQQLLDEFPDVSEAVRANWSTRAQQLTAGPQGMPAPAMGAR